MTDNDPKIIEDLGDDFEVIEDSGPPPSPAAPAVSAKPAPPAGGAPAPGQPPAPLRSADSWVSLGLAVGFAGLIGDWNGASSNLVHGLLLAAVLWTLLRNGFGSVQPANPKLTPLVPAALALYGALRTVISLAMQTDLGAMFGWRVDGGLTAVSGAIFAFLGGAIALVGPRLGGKKDAKLPPRPAPRQVDPQFSGSLFAYLLCFVGLTMKWTPSDTGAGSLFGVITLICVVLALWASWVGLWKLWTMPIVTGKLGMILFLAPIEAMVMSLGGLLLQTDSPPSVVTDAWPGQADPFLVYGGGPILTLVGSAMAMYLLLTGAKQAVAMSKERKAQEVEARKAARAGRKSGKK